MNGEAWTDAGIEALIRRLEGDDWRERAADIHRDLPGWVLEGRITEERAERLTDAIQARQDRTARAATDKIELRKHDGHVIGGSIGRIVMLMEDGMRSAPPSPPAVVPKIRAGVRGPSRHTPEERRERSIRRHNQAHLVGVPVQVVEGLYTAARSVLSVIVFDCRTTVAGACERAVAQIAGAAGCSESTVQQARAELVARGLIAVEDRPGKTNRITIISTEILDWIGRAERFCSILSDEQNSSSDEDYNEAPPRGVIDYGGTIEEPSQGVQEGVSGRVGAEQAPRASTGQETNPRGIRAAWDQMLDRTNALVAAAARSRDRDGELGREGDCPTSA